MKKLYALFLSSLIFSGAANATSESSIKAERVYIKNIADIISEVSYWHLGSESARKIADAQGLFVLVSTGSENIGDLSLFTKGVRAFIDENVNTPAEFFAAAAYPLPSVLDEEKNSELRNMEPDDFTWESLVNCAASKLDLKAAGLCRMQIIYNTAYRIYQHSLKSDQIESVFGNKNKINTILSLINIKISDKDIGGSETPKDFVGDAAFDAAIIKKNALINIREMEKNW